MSNLLRLGQEDPQLPPGCEFLSVTEVEGHFLAGIPRYQRGAVLHELVGRLHVWQTRCCPLTTQGTCPAPGPGAHTDLRKYWRWRMNVSMRKRFLLLLLLSCLMAVGKPAQGALPPPTGLECGTGDYAQNKTKKQKKTPLDYFS